MCRANQDSKSKFKTILDFFQPHEHGGSLIIEKKKKLLLKIIFFEVSSVISNYVKFQYFDIRNSILETEQTHRFVLTSRIQIWAQITVLTNEWKIDILDNFAPRVGILEIELGSSYEQGWASIRGKYLIALSITILKTFSE